MMKLDIKDFEALRTFQYGLVMGCPLPGSPNPSYCQLHELRLLPVEERFQWVDKLSDEECLRYYLAHKQCYSERASMEGLV
jgi:hypothetical protein